MRSVQGLRPYPVTQSFYLVAHIYKRRILPLKKFRSKLFWCTPPATYHRTHTLTHLNCRPAAHLCWNKYASCYMLQTCRTIPPKNVHPKTPSHTDLAFKLYLPSTSCPNIQLSSNTSGKMLIAIDFSRKHFWLNAYSRTFSIKNLLRNNAKTLLAKGFLPYTSRQTTTADN